MRKFYVAMIACATMTFCLSASAAPLTWCKFVATEIVLHPDGTSNPSTEDLGFGYFIVDSSSSANQSNYSITYAKMTVNGPQNAAQVTIGTGPSSGGFEDFPSESLFSDNLDFTRPINKIFPVSGNPLVYKNQYNKTYLQSLSLVCTTQNPYN